MYLPLPALLDDLSDAIGERGLAFAAQYPFERYLGGPGNRQFVLLPAPDRAVAGDQQCRGDRRLRQPERLAATTARPVSPRVAAGNPVNWLTGKPSVHLGGSRTGER